MRRSIFAGLSTALLIFTAEAQTSAANVAGLVETARPHIGFRALSADEQKQAVRALGQWKSRKTEANLAAVRPFAEAGDKASLETMMEGYMHLLRTPRDRGASAALTKPEAALKPLAALWASALWRQSGGSLAAAKALQPCMTNNMQNTVDVARFDYHKSEMIIPSQTIEFDCGFDTRGTIPALDAILKAARDNRAPKSFLPVAFIERPVVDQALVEEARLKDILARVVAPVGLVDMSEVDRRWLYERAAKEPAVAKRLEEAKFEGRLREISKGANPIPQNDTMWAYMQSDPERIRRHAAAISAASSQRLNENIQVTATLANGRPEDRESSSWIAIRSSDTANLWWKTYAGNLSGNVPMLPYWCGAGVSEACAIQQQATTAAEFRDKYGDPASLNSGRFAGPTGSINQDQFAKERADAKAACLAGNVNNGATCTD